MTIIRLLSALLLITVSSSYAFCKDDESEIRRKRARLIKDNKSYYSGVGYGETQEEADRQSIIDLCSKISISVNHTTVTNDTQDSETFTSQGAIATFVTLSNTERFDVSSEPGRWEIIRYVEKAQVENDMAMRREKIQTLVNQGLNLEKRLEIASALKYFNWAYALSRTYSTPVMIELDQINHDAKTWLSAHINSMFNSIKIELDNIEERPGELDPYLFNLRVSYLNQPVGDLDFSYVNNGNRIRDQHVKNGRASLAFEKIPADKIEFSIDYKYQTEGSQYDSELAAIYNAKNAPAFPKARIEVPCKGSDPKKFQIQEKKLSKDERKAVETDAQLAPASVAPPRKRIETTALADDKAKEIINCLNELHEAIKTKKFAATSDLFTSDGFALFSRMMQSGQVKSAKNNPDWKIELAGDYIIGKSIPVTIKYSGGHTVSEEIVCRFNEDFKIESVAYALSQRAEDDIFRQNSWGLDARYAILRFMEDYQTAYALKRIDYIDKIFSDDAVIISGKRNNNAQMKKSDGSYFLTESFTYTKESKKEFIDRLKRDFPQKKYIKLTFEDNEIKEQSGIYNNIFWIEIKQFYSSSNYNDDGYLTLMIDMREANPTIKVRTWAPSKIPLTELMRRYTVE